MKYNLSDYTKEVIKKMKNGWILIYDTSDKIPFVDLKKDGHTESISNWTLTELCRNELVNSDNGYPVSKYTLKKPKYRLYWSLFDQSWACFHYDDNIKREGHFLRGPIIAYCYPAFLKMFPNANGDVEKGNIAKRKEYSQL